MAKSVLIIGEDPQYLDFSAPYLPPGISAEKILAGLNGARDRLLNAGYEARIVLTKDEHTVEAQVSDALKDKSYDVIVVGAGIRLLPPLTAQFERLMNLLHQKAPTSRLAFNSMPDDSDAAALRWLQAD
jgi:trans-aconitate methyltransferase